MAFADLVNCILLAAGCQETVTVDDINDIDNIPNRLTELQGLYEDVGGCFFHWSRHN
jgi:cohesin complex subunit SA-1/2